MTLGNAGILIVRTVAGERGHLARDLVEQGPGLGAIINVTAGQWRGDDLSSIRVHAEVQLLPGPARFCPCFAISQSPAPNSLSPVLSTSRCKGAALPSA